MVYVDGYNWYHAIFKHYPEWKWLNIQSFFEYLLSRDDVVAVKVFSAMVDPHIKDSASRGRQDLYFNVLRTFPKIQLILGAFQPREVSCRANCKQRYIVQEEKKTDVNIAVHMLSDVIDDKVDRICAVTGDSDIQPAVEWIAKRKPNIRITVYVPCLPNEQRNRRTDYYTTKGLNVDCRFLPLGDIKNHLLKPVVKIAGGKFAACPESWKPRQQ